MKNLSTVKSLIIYIQYAVHSGSNESRTSDRTSGYDTTNVVYGENVAANQGRTIIGLIGGIASLACVVVIGTVGFVIYHKKVQGCREERQR